MSGCCWPEGGEVLFRVSGAHGLHPYSRMPCSHRATLGSAPGSSPLQSPVTHSWGRKSWSCSLASNSIAAGAWPAMGGDLQGPQGSCRCPCGHLLAAYCVPAAVSSRGPSRRGQRWARAPQGSAEFCLQSAQVRTGSLIALQVPANRFAKDGQRGPLCQQGAALSHLS